MYFKILLFLVILFSFSLYDVPYCRIIRLISNTESVTDPSHITYRLHKTSSGSYSCGEIPIGSETPQQSVFCGIKGFK